MHRVSLHSELEERRFHVLLVSPGAQQDQRGSQVYELQEKNHTGEWSVRTPFLAHRPPRDWPSEARVACGQFPVVWPNYWVNLARA